MTNIFFKKFHNLFYYFFFQSEVHEVEAANIVKNENLLRTTCQKKVCETAIPSDTISHCNMCMVIHENNVHIWLWIWKMHSKEIP